MIDFLLTGKACVCFQQLRSRRRGGAGSPPTYRREEEECGDSHSINEPTAINTITLHNWIIYIYLLADDEAMKWGDHWPCHGVDEEEGRSKSNSSASPSRQELNEIDQDSNPPFVMELLCFDRANRPSTTDSKESSSHNAHRVSRAGHRWVCSGRGSI